MIDLVLNLTRVISNQDTTIGILKSELLSMFSLEDAYRKEKIAGITRIPQGIYGIKYRKEGGMLDDYKKIYPNHIGMLHLQNVPNYEYVYIHTGNNHSHTNGCILVGFGCVLNKEYTITNSKDAYLPLFQEIQKAFDSGRKVFIKITDNDIVLND